MSPFDASDFNTQMMKGLFAEIYPVIARWAIERSGIRAGLCLDLGGGPGMLAVRLAEASELRVVLVDPEPECIVLAQQNVAAYGVGDRVGVRLGRAEQLPFADRSVDLVVSRGSIFFWDDQREGLREVLRVLRPGGWAFIGGGFGTAELRREILAKMADNEEWNRERRERNAKNPPEHFAALVAELGLPGRLEITDAGTWIVINVPEAGAGVGAESESVA